jgi:DNA-binding response OmpR family regulator
MKPMSKISESSAKPKARVLVVEDETAMRIGLQDALEAEGYRVILAENGKIGLEKAVAEKPDLIIMDVMMPHIDGYSLTRHIRHIHQNLPILMVTARGEVSDRVRGLDSGADDYLMKPFSSDELLARIRALLRRTRRAQRQIETISVGNLQIQLSARQVQRCGKDVRLTWTEFALLQALIESAPEPVSREKFLDVVWGYAAFPTTRTVDTHITSLRQKIEEDPAKPQLIKTVHGFGYRIDSDAFLTET